MRNNKSGADLGRDPGQRSEADQGVDPGKVPLSIHEHKHNDGKCDIMMFGFSSIASSPEDEAL